MHVFADASRFPFASDRLYTPPTATVDDLLALQRALGFDRVVVVQPSVYGTDNRVTVDAIRQLGAGRARGVAVIGPDTAASELDAMAGAGIRGIRLNLETAGVIDPAPATRILQAATKQIAGRGWHIQTYARLSLIAALHDTLAALPVPLVFDHFAGTNGALGADQPGFAAMLDLVRSGKAYVKLSAPYRASDQAPGYPGLTALAQGLVAANPDRMLWASDWPHPAGPAPATIKPTDIRPPYDTDDGCTLNLLAGWVPDAATRHRILVDNPAQLYGF